MRTLGVDAGTVRIGLAVSDPDGLVATPLDTLRADGDVAARIAERAATEGCEAVVVGLPRALHGGDTDSTRHARAIAEGVRAHGVEVHLWDERLSSAEAERTLLGAGRSRAQRRDERDRVAAAIILQGWLDARRRAATRE